MEVGNLHSYQQRIKSLLGQDTQIIDNLKSGNILEIGFVSTALMEVASEIGNSIYGLSESQELVDEANEKGLDNVLYGRPLEADKLFLKNSFDTIILTNTLSTVFSESRNSNDGLSNHLADLNGANQVKRVLKMVHELLKDNGKIIVNDGARVPIYMEDDLVSMLLSNSELSKIDDYQNFKSNSKSFHKVPLVSESRTMITCGLGQAIEFMTSYVEDSDIGVSREKRHGVLSIDDFETFLSAIGYENVVSVPYTRDGYDLALRHLEFSNMTRVSDELPDLHMILIGRK